MKSFKILLLSLFWIALTHQIKACEQTNDDLSTLCLKIASGQSDNPDFSPGSLGKYLPQRLREKILLVEEDQQKPLCSLVLSWITPENIDKQEVALRYSLIALTEKLAHVPTNERESVMASLNKIVDLAVSENNTHSNALKMVRLKLISSINHVNKDKLNALLSSALTSLIDIPSDQVIEKFCNNLK